MNEMFSATNFNKNELLTTSRLDSPEQIYKIEDSLVNSDWTNNSNIVIGFLLVVVICVVKSLYVYTRESGNTNVDKNKYYRV